MLLPEKIKITQKRLMMICCLLKKTIDNVLYKDAKKKFNNKNKNIFQKAKKFDLRVNIYKKLIFERENLKFEESVAEREN